MINSKELSDSQKEGTVSGDVIANCARVREETGQGMGALGIKKNRPTLRNQDRPV